MQGGLIETVGHSVLLSHVGLAPQQESVPEVTGEAEDLAAFSSREIQTLCKKKSPSDCFNFRPHVTQLMGCCLSHSMPLLYRLYYITHSATHNTA